MDRSEKLRLCADEKYGHCFKQGLFARFFEQSLYWFTFAVNAIDAPTLRGDTGIGEIGISLKPSQSLPLSFDLGMQGYVGQREGVTGSLQLRFEF